MAVMLRAPRTAHEDPQPAERALLTAGRDQPRRWCPGVRGNRCGSGGFRTRAAAARRGDQRVAAAADHTAPADSLRVW
jgi:hypothetical protein